MTRTSSERSRIASLDVARGVVMVLMAIDHVRVFGEVPFFYYVLHIPLLPPPVPDGFRWSLALLYLVTAGVVIALYFPCWWYAARKREAKRPWMRLL